MACANAEKTSGATIPPSLKKQAVASAENTSGAAIPPTPKKQVADYGDMLPQIQGIAAKASNTKGQKYKRLYYL